MIIKFYVYRFYICTILIYCAYLVSKVSDFAYNVLSFLNFAVYYNGLYLEQFYLDRFFAVTNLLDLFNKVSLC